MGRSSMLGSSPIHGGVFLVHVLVPVCAFGALHAAPDVKNPTLLAKSGVFYLPRGVGVARNPNP